jgi:hypothetical protein
LETGQKNGLHWAKSQLIRAGEAQGMSPFIDASSVMFIYVKIRVVLMYFTGKGRI